MFKSQLLSLLALTFTAALMAQAPAAPEKSDPEAKKILDKIRKKYEGFKTVEADFSLTIEVPGEAKEVQKGSIAQEGSKFRLDMEPQVIISDAKTTWIYLKKNKEVQITDAEPNGSDNGFMTPQDLLKRYQKGDFLYAITDKTTEGGKMLTQIEFKPKDKKSEYSKFRLSIDEKAGAIAAIRAFGKDGSRYAFVINKLNTNKSFPAGYFQFDAKKYPGVKVEDLRM